MLLEVEAKIAEDLCFFAVSNAECQCQDRRKVKEASEARGRRVANVRESR